MANFAAKTAFDAALNLEMIGRHEHWDRADEALGVLKDSMAELEEALKAFAKERAACEY